MNVTFSPDMVTVRSARALSIIIAVYMSHACLEVVADWREIMVTTATTATVTAAVEFTRNMFYN